MASVAVTLTVFAPDAVLLPEISPVLALIASPAGRPVASQLYGEVPPAAATNALYATFAWAAGSDVVVMESAAVIVSVSDLVLLW